VYLIYNRFLKYKFREGDRPSPHPLKYAPVRAEFTGNRRVIFMQTRARHTCTHNCATPAHHVLTPSFYILHRFFFLHRDPFHEFYFSIIYFYFYANTVFLSERLDSINMLICSIEREIRRRLDTERITTHLHRKSRTDEINTKTVSGR
jgi:hypothetical protein